MQKVGDKVTSDAFLYLNYAAVNAVVRMPESPVIPPLPDGSLCRLGTALLQHYINCKDTLSRQAGHQLTARKTAGLRNNTVLFIPYFIE